MAEVLRLTAKHLDGIESVLPHIYRADRVEVTLEEPFVASPFSTAMFVAALARDNRQLFVGFGKSAPSAAVRKSIQASYLRALLWGDAPVEPLSIWTESLIRSAPAIHKEFHFARVQPSYLSSSSREGFQAEIAQLFSRAAIPVPGKSLAAVASVGFEINSNAEEHGCVRVDSIGETFRITLAALRETLSPSDSPDAAAYLEEYFESGHSSAEPWLELIVVDSGMGVAYPNYKIWCEDRREGDGNLYAIGAEDERVRLGLVLNRTSSTKGRWGRTLNLQTSVGEGIKSLRQRLANIRGYAAVRAGRSFGYWKYALVQPAERPRYAPYDIAPVEYPLFLGTAWHILVPLGAQLTLKW